MLELYILPVIIRIRKGETTMNEPKHMLITYSSEKAESGHVDPNFTKLVYGNSKRTGKQLEKNITPGSYIFSMLELIIRDI